MQWPPAGAEPLVSFVVSGEPKGAGSKDAIPLGKRVNGYFHPYTRKDGTPIVNVVDSSGKPGKLWREAIAGAARDALDEAHELADGPLVLEATFYIERPQAHFGSGRNAGVLKDSAPAFPHASKLPDGTKLMRALEDALTGTVWSDDRRIVESRWVRRYGEDPGVCVRIWTLPEQVDLMGETLFDAVA